jgi:hypothetical protein
MNVLLIKIKDLISGQEFYDRASCLYVPGLEHLLSYLQSLCEGCQVSCKCSSNSSLDQTVTTTDANGSLRKFNTFNMDGLFYIRYSLCSEAEKMKFN